MSLALLLLASIPMLESIEPPHVATAGGASVRLHGAGFVAGTRAALVGRNRIDLACRLHSSALFECDAPAHDAGPIDVVVTTPDGAASLPRTLVYFELHSVRPSRGPAESDTQIVLSDDFFP